jgi:hypothetical protein
MRKDSLTDSTADLVEREEKGLFLERLFVLESEV